MSRTAETGESTASIVKRGDNLSWSQIETALRAGATLKRVPSLRRSYADFGQGPQGSGISDTRLRSLEHAGIIRHVGVDRYNLAEAPAETDAQRLARIRNIPMGLLTEDEIGLLDPASQKYARGFQAQRAKEAACPDHESVGEGTREQSRRGWHPAHCKHCGMDMSIDSGD